MIRTSSLAFAYEQPILVGGTKMEIALKKILMPTSLTGLVLISWWMTATQNI